MLYLFYYIHTAAQKANQMNIHTRGRCVGMPGLNLNTSIKKEEFTFILRLTRQQQPNRVYV